MVSTRRADASPCHESDRSQLPTVTSRQNGGSAQCRAATLFSDTHWNFLTESWCPPRPNMRRFAALSTELAHNHAAARKHAIRCEHCGAARGRFPQHTGARAACACVRACACVLRACVCVCVCACRTRTHRTAYWRLPQYASLNTCTTASSGRAHVRIPSAPAPNVSPAGARPGKYASSAASALTPPVHCT